MTYPAEPDLIDDVNEALSTALAKHETSITTRWVTLVETIDDDGGRGLWTLADNDAKPWDVLGLLEYALTKQHAQVMADRLGHGGDE